MPDNNQPNQNSNQNPAQSTPPVTPPQPSQPSAPAQPQQSAPAPSPAPTPMPAPTPTPAPAPAQPAKQPVPPTPQKQTPPAPKATAPAPAPHSKRNLLISGAIILVVLIALFIAPQAKNKDAADDNEEVIGEEVIGEGNGSALPEENDDESPALSRAEALAAFNGKAIKINGACEVTPQTQTQAKGTTILIDNNTDVAHMVTVGPKSYRVSGQHYTLSWLNLAPGTLIVTCDGKDTEARITVQ